MTNTLPQSEVQEAGSARFAVRVTELHKTYGTGEAAVHAVNGVSVDFAAGQFTAVMGPSGSGKSTLMHIVAGLDTATSGKVLLAGTDLTTLSDKELTAMRRDRIGFVFQQFNLVPILTAQENITLPLDLAGTKPDRAWVDLIVETLGLQARLTQKPEQLSGGQRQRVAVARALASRPS